MITLDSVSKSYAKGQPAVNNVSLHIEKGEFVFIVGNSGSGKSTLIKLLLKELEPTSGTIKVNGQILNKMKRWRVPKYRRGVGVVFQDFRHALFDDAVRFLDDTLCECYIFIDIPVF